MNTVQTVEPLRGRDYTPQQISLIKRTVAADCNDDEFSLFVEVCKRVGLDPFRRQIYAIVYSKDNPKKRKMSIVTGIDGFRAVAARCGDYRPDTDEPIIVVDTDLKDPATNPLGIERAVYTAYKKDPDNGDWFPVKATAYWDEFAPITEEWAENDQGKWRPTGKESIAATSNWRKMGRVMIVKCAEAQALRKGWPEDLSGVYSPEEMDRSLIDLTAAEAAQKFEQEDRLLRVGVKGAIPMIWDAEQGIESVPVGVFADRVIGHVLSLTKPDEIDVFQRKNQTGLRQFWATEMSDALALKEQIEKHAANLKEAV